MPDQSFPESFLWGAATSSFQIEGDPGGRGQSIWDTFCRQPGKVLGGDTGDVACEHVARYRDDVQLLKELGVHAYRFSVAWPRVLPFGDAEVNEAGLDFYDRLVDELLAQGIDPWVTLYHWDLPQALQDHGGWPARRTVDAFVHFADVVSRRLGDRVGNWITHNEPWCVSILGHQQGLHAPGWKDPAAALAAAHHVLLSHGRAVPVLRANVPGARVGLTVNLVPAVPASDSEADLLATRALDGHLNRWFLDPLAGRGYPADQIEQYRHQGFVPAEGPLPFVQEGDLETIGVETDFLGVNYYSRGIIRSDTIPEEANAPRTIPAPAKEDCTDIGWEVWPDGLYDLLLRLRDEYPQPIYITENGASYGTGPDDDGVVRDAGRQAYLAGHLQACWRALQEGVDLRGYFVWSLMDNFEWQEGYSQRFGVVWVDFETQQRILKESGHFYRRVVRQNGLGGGAS
jgi:beta-glucosidase